jgi:predicted Zn-dependent protease
VQAGLLVQRARAAGIEFLTTNNRTSRDEARDDLDDAEKIVRDEIKRNAACEPCIETQAAVHLLRSSFRFANEYEKALEVAGKGLERFPQNPRLAYLKGFAHYSRGEAHQATAALKRFLTLAPADPLAPEVRQMAAAAEQVFLTTWYNQANFYQSNESRVFAYNPQTYQNQLIFQVTPDYELQLGQLGFSQLSQSAPPANDPETVAFLQQLVGRIVEKTAGPQFRYDVTLLDSNDVNAVTPPGHIIVYTGLLRFVDTEAQLAGVLSHEIAHNYAHHSARRLIKTYHAQAISAAVARAINPQSATAQLITQISSVVGVGLFVNAYSRFEEREADFYGAHLMFNAGYNPTAMPSTFLKLYEANPRQPVKFLSTHPPAPDRVNYLSDYLEAFPLDRELVVGSSEAFVRLKGRYPSAVAPAPALIPR